MEEEAGMLGLHGRASYAKIGMLREAEDGGGEVAGGGCGRQARGGRKEARSARRLDAVIRRSSAGVCGLVLPAVEVVVLVVGSLLSSSLFL